MSNPKIGFEMRQIHLLLENILPIRQIKDPEKNIRRYGTILASIKEIGVVEPLMVYPQNGAGKNYMLVDGHLRCLALKELGRISCDCIIANDDESFTYNARINRLSPIQEHRMIMKAVQSGVKPERIATTLNLPLRRVRERINLLKNVHEGAVDLLKDKNIATKAIGLLKRVVGLRQTEIAELMIGANNFTAAYAEALIFATPPDQMAKSGEIKKKKGLSQEEIARMEEQMESLGQDVSGAEKNYGENVLNLTLARGYIKKLLDNAKVIRFLSAKHAGIFSEFEAIVAAASL